MLRYLFCVPVLLTVFIWAGPAMALDVADAVITTAIVDRESVDAVDVFPLQNGKLYCFTRIVGAEEDTVVYHLWYREGQLMSRVGLPVKSSSWRTWSAKNLLEDWPGEWWVEIQSASGEVLQKLEFQLRD